MPDDNPSRYWRDRALAVLPLGSSTNSKVPQFLPEEPQTVTRGRGCRVWDHRGLEFIDYRNALGAITLGYCDPVVDDAISNQLEDGILFGHPHPSETVAAELFCSLVPGAERARFLKTGGEALAAIIRIARAFTGRDEIIQIGYNGWLNALGPDAEILPASSGRARGVPRILTDLHHYVGWEDRDRIEGLFTERGDRIALVLVAADYPSLPHAASFYTFLRDLTSRNNALLGYDEMVTGFRIALGGVAEYAEVTPDLAVHGKGIANGMPLSVYSGRADIFSTLQRKEVTITSTHGGEALSLAAAIATMRMLRDEKIIPRLHRSGNYIRDGINSLFEESNLPLELSGLGPCPQFTATAEHGELLLERFFRASFRYGVSLYRVLYVNAAHTPADLDETLDRLQQACKSIKNGMR